MLVHAVFFWLKPDLTPEQEARFETGVNSLLSIPNLVHRPRGHARRHRTRPVIDTSPIPTDCSPCSRTSPPMTPTRWIPST